MSKQMMKRMLLLIWLVLLEEAINSEAIVEKPIRKYKQVILSCGCLASENASLVWLQLDNTGSTIVKSADDTMGPKLYDQQEELQLQQVLESDKRYLCLSNYANGTVIICGDYVVKMYDCKDSAETIRPEDVTNLDVGNAATFNCTHYFPCDQFKGDISVTMTTTIKNYNVFCSTSNMGLQQTCQLQIPKLIEEDFGQDVRCVVNESGTINVFKASPVKKKIKTIQEQTNQLVYILGSVLTLAVVLIVFLFLIQCERKKKYRYRLKSLYKFFNLWRKLKEGIVMVYSFDEEDLHTSLPALGKFLEDLGYSSETVNDIQSGQNLLDGYSEIANRCDALVIVVHMKFLENEENCNRLENLLYSPAILGGKSQIWPLYTTILYVHENYEENVRQSRSINIQDRHRKLGQHFQSIDFKGNDNTKALEKLKQRLPPIKQPKNSPQIKDTNGNVAPVEETQNRNCYSTFPTDITGMTNGNYSAPEEGILNRNCYRTIPTNINGTIPSYNRMESNVSNISCSSESPLIPEKY